MHDVVSRGEVERQRIDSMRIELSGITTSYSQAVRSMKNGAYSQS